MDGAPILQGDYAAAGGNRYRSRDGRRLVEVEVRAQGFRDLHAAFVRMAQTLSRERKVAKGILAAWMPKATDDRIRREWGEVLNLFKPAIASRMGLVVVHPDRCLALGEDRELRKIGEAVRARLGKVEPAPREGRPALSRSSFEVFKVLLGQHLLGKGPIAIGELMRRTGCSYPTVAESLRRLEAAEELKRLSNRSVQFARFPRKTWIEVLALSESLRRTRFYADPSGRAPDPAALHRRLQGVPNEHLAVGGVQAARHYDPHFDLHGLPRVDVSLRMREEGFDFAFVGRLDPALQRVEPGAPGVVLSVHPLHRPEAAFEKNPKGKVGWADPVETLLDLHELRLADQAERLVERLEGRARK